MLLTGRCVRHRCHIRFRHRLLLGRRSLDGKGHSVTVLRVQPLPKPICTQLIRDDHAFQQLLVYPPVPGQYGLGNLKAFFCVHPFPKRLCPRDDCQRKIVE